MPANRFFLAAAAALLLPLPAFAQQGPPAGRSPAARMLVEESSIDFLLTKSADLALTPELTAKLKELDSAFDEKAKPIRAQIRAQLPQDPAADREAMRAAFQQVRPLTQQLRELDRQYADEAVKLLPAASQAKATQLLEERRAARMPRRAPGGAER